MATVAAGGLPGEWKTVNLSRMEIRSFALTEMTRMTVALSKQIPCSKR